MNTVLDEILSQYPDDESLWQKLFFDRKTVWTETLRSVSLHADQTYKVHDWCRLNTPARFGLGVRTYFWGDPLKTLSRRLYQRTQQMFTQLDYDDSQFSVTLIWCDSPSLTYAGVGEKPQGTLALMIADRLKSYHLRQNHRLHLRWFRYNDRWDVLCEGIKTSEIILIGDGLWKSSWLESWSEFFSWFKMYPHKMFQVYQVRANTCCVEHNPLSQKGWTLKPFTSKTPLFLGQSTRHSGEGYIESLKKEEQRLREAFLQFPHVQLFLIDQQHLQFNPNYRMC